MNSIPTVTLLHQLSGLLSESDRICSSNAALKQSEASSESNLGILLVLLVCLLRPAPHDRSDLI